MNYKVTLAMPVYNVEKYVERALLSALNQTFDSIEFLIVDDKGTDRSMEIVNEIVSTHPRGKDVRIIDHVVNQGTGATKNSAIREAKGEYLFFMDSDDEITDDCIQTLYETILKENVDCVVGNYCIPQHAPVHNMKNVLLKSNADILKYVFKEQHPFFIYTWNKLYRISFLRDNDIKCIPYHTCEDNLFTFQVLCHIGSLVIIDKVTYFYYQYETSFMGVKRKIGFSDKTANMHADIIEFKVNYLLNNQIHYKDYIKRKVFYEASSYMVTLLQSDLEFGIKKKYLSKFQCVSKLKINKNVFEGKVSKLYYVFRYVNNVFAVYIILLLCLKLNAK
mgnify:CR=1 FL=1